jgi:NAD(P)-dependent dehydrogenase (short-subunit alcohol dehydrogenase family)
LITYAADVSDMAECDRLAQTLIENHGGVEILINNAGRSIRRGIESSYDRFHDFERTMQLNYFGALRLTMGLLPGMVAKKHGQVINISSIGVLTNAPRFSAYVASKAALDAWTRCAASEFSDIGIKFTTINMPLVRTPMIAPTKIYQNIPTLSPDDAADLIAQAIVYKPVRIATRLGILGVVVHALVPRIAQIIMNTSFRMFPDSDAAQIKSGDKKGPSMNADQMALQQLLRGIHF